MLNDQSLKSKYRYTYSCNFQSHMHTVRVAWITNANFPNLFAVRYGKKLYTWARVNIFLIHCLAQDLLTEENKNKQEKIVAATDRLTLWYFVSFCQVKEINYSGNKVILTSSEGKRLAADKVHNYHLCQAYHHHHHLQWSSVYCKPYNSKNISPSGSSQKTFCSGAQ